MDAVKFIKENSRMCKETKCSLCPAGGENDGCILPCVELMGKNPEKYVSIVEEWSKEHPAKTRQSEFLKMFPNAKMTELGSLKICPTDVDRNIECSGENCTNCREAYWLTEADGTNINLIDREQVIKVVDKHTNEDGTLDEDISVILEEIS